MKTSTYTRLMNETHCIKTILLLSTSQVREVWFFPLVLYCPVHVMNNRSPQWCMWQLRGLWDVCGVEECWEKSLHLSYSFLSTLEFSLLSLYLERKAAWKFNVLSRFPPSSSLQPAMSLPSWRFSYGLLTWQLDSPYGF